MKIAIIGSGISGLFAAHYLSKQHQVTVYEAKTRLGGHTETHALQLDGKVLAVDTGFIVFNELNYPKFCRFLQDLGVASQASDMSFSVANALTGLEYNGQTLDQLFCQRRNLLRPRFYGMVMDILRFYREAPALLLRHDDELTLGDYLLQQGYGQMFIDEHILPLACALWSGPAELLKKFPARYFVAFMANHQMLKTRDRPRWRTVCGGSSTYIQAFLDNFSGDLRVHCPVLAVYREPAGVRVVAQDGEANYDQLILACHSDQALALLQDASIAEAEILGAMPFQQNEVVLHTDASLMPKHPKAWASWNALKFSSAQERCTVTYCMNLLQNLDTTVPILVSLNCTDRIDPGKILQQITYQHPVYTPASLAAQRRRAAINGQHHTWYAGAYWGWGFHEDGASSAQDIIDALSLRA